MSQFDAVVANPPFTPDVSRKRRAADLMTDPPFSLDGLDREIVRDAIVALWAEKA
jgi:REP element-mobilizing transposase RayT